jgi:hypothetical protein
MNEPKDPEAAETVQTENIKAVDPAAFCYASSIRRWNFETRGGEIWVCEGDHEKSESCITNSREVFACEAIEIIERLRSESLETIIKKP